MTTTEELLAKLNPKTAAAFRKASTVESRKLETPSLGINLATGGLRYGQIHTLWGNRSSGKSLFCLGLARKAQEKGETVAWIDAEKNFDPDWARRHGVDPDKILLASITSIADMADAAVDFISAGVDLFIVDSMSVLLPQSFFVDKDTGELKNLADTGQIGTFSKNYAAALNMINNLNEKTCVVMISQLRNKITTYGAAKSLMGGEAAEFMNSTIIKFWSNPAEKESIKGKIKSGDIILERPIGRPVTWTIDKSRGPGMNMSNTYDLYFAGDYVGVDLIGEILDLGVERGVIRKGGKWYYLSEEEKFDGRKNAVAYLRETVDAQDRLYKEILATA